MTVRNITKSSFVALRNGSFPTLSILFFFYIQTSYIPIVVGRIPGIQLMKLVIFFFISLVLVRSYLSGNVWNRDKNLLFEISFPLLLGVQTDTQFWHF